MTSSANPNSNDPAQQSGDSAAAARYKANFENKGIGVGTRLRRFEFLPVISGNVSVWRVKS